MPRPSFSNQVVGNASLTHFDVLIIGSGASGGTLARILTASSGDGSSPMKVLMLESGPNYFQGLEDPNRPVPGTAYSGDTIKWLRRRLVTYDEEIEPRTFRHDESVDRSFVGDVQHLAKVIGGAATHADLKFPRFQPDDFIMGDYLARKWRGTSFVNWPFTYDELEPFYSFIEWETGTQGAAGINPYEGHRSRDFPMPVGIPMFNGQLMSEAAKRLGYHPYPYATAINSRPFAGRPACTDCGFCSQFGCPTGAKGVPAVTVLRTALFTGNLQIRTETRATRIVVNGTGTEVAGVEAIGPDGEKLFFTADRYIVAASAIESARLVLLSDPTGMNRGIGNQSGQVGRNLMFHLETHALGLFKYRLHGHRGRDNTNCMNDFRGFKDNEDWPLAGITEFGTGPDVIEEALAYALQLPAFVAPRKREMLRLMMQSPLRDRMGLLTMCGEDAPQPINRVDIDPEVRDYDGIPVARITYKNHEFELNSRRKYMPRLEQLLREAGAMHTLIGPDSTDPDTGVQVPDSRHVGGTLRMGKDPRTSVVDPTGKFHQLGNLYCADGSVFPTFSGFNPTLTIMAIAAKVAGHMRYGQSPERAISHGG